MVWTSPYYVRIPSQDILTFLFSSTKFKNNEAIWINGEKLESQLTLATTKRLVGCIGRGLRDLGVGLEVPGEDIVLSFVENQIMVAPMLFGVLCAEGIHSTCSPLATAFELARQIDMTDPKVLICSSQTRNAAEQAIKRIKKSPPILLELDSDHLDLRKVSDRKSILTNGELVWRPLFDPKTLQQRIACLIFSSGTTGIPKGVELSHANIVANLCQMGYHFGPRAELIQKQGRVPRMPALLQNSVPAGILIHSMMALQHRMQVIMMKKYDFNILKRYIHEHSLSVLFLAPPIWNRIVNELKSKDLVNIRWALSGGSPLPLALQQRVNEILPTGTFLLQNWGMTELVCAATQFSPNELDEEGSVGRLVPNMQAMIVGEDGQPLNNGQSGELLVKGPNVMTRYYNNPTATQQASNAAGWFRTGDKAVINANGKVFIEGRYKGIKSHQ